LIIFDQFLKQTGDMKYSKWIGILAAVTIILICYQPWIYVGSANLEIGGMHASGKHNFGRPGLMNIIMTTGALVMFFLPFIWAKRLNIFFVAFNIAWSIRNYILLTRCYGGDCPQKKAGLYILIIASLVMLIAAFVPDISVEQKKKQ
jgi:hypothetical protein